MVNGTDGSKQDLKSTVKVLEGIVAALDPEVLEPRFAADLVEIFTRIERLGAAGKALAARRVSSSGIWRSSGERSAAHWMAKKTGTSVGQADNVLEAAEKLSELCETDKAMRAGDLSETQAVQIASAAAASPSSEKELLEFAKDESVNDLKQRCARVRASALPDEAARHEAAHRKRYLRHYLDLEGAFRLDGRLTPEAGAVLLAALEPARDRLMTEAKKEGSREPSEAFAADALVEMAEHSRRCSDDPERKSPSAIVHVRVDHAALKRGEVREGEICEVPGVGPIPVAAARSFLSDSFLSLIFTEGDDIKSIANVGRTIPSRVRTALNDRDTKCVVPGCTYRRHLQIDHNVPFAEGGETRLDNLAKLCRRHHYLKTYRGYTLSGGPGSWVWRGPKEKPEGLPEPSCTSDRSPS